MANFIKKAVPAAAPSALRNSRLTEHLAKLRASKAVMEQEELNYKRVIFWGTTEDTPYLPYLKACVGETKVFLRSEKVPMLAMVQAYCKAKGIYEIISTSPTLLRVLTLWDKKAAPKLHDYAGSMFTIPAGKIVDKEIKVVFIPSLTRMPTISYNKFLTKRIVSKFTNPDSWLVTPEFNWSLLLPENEADKFQEFSDPSCFMIAVDIETLRTNAVIRCLSYTAAFWDSTEPSGIRTDTVVLAIDSDYSAAIMTKWNWELKAPKVLQNGRYDIAYLARYSAPLYNYLYDTATMFHSMFSELPKDLGFLNAFFVKEAMYWKDLAETDDLMEYYRYNALDTWGTLCCFLGMIREATKPALTNYLLEFPIVFPCHLAEMTGIKRDMSRLEEAKVQQQEIIDREYKSLNTILGVQEPATFNVNSPPQMKALFTILGCGHFKSRDAKNIKKAMYMHPLNGIILEKVLTLRKALKLVSTYLTAGKEFTDLAHPEGDRILYGLNPGGTDSSRLASSSHHFWCGVNKQNIPKGPIVKQTYMADPGFLLCEVDLEQAESRDTAYISGDEALIDSVEHSPDFHCSNASKFFGVPFDQLYDIARGEVINKDLRTLGKPVNHGANYNMGKYVLVDTMGLVAIYKAKKLLGLNKFWGATEVAEYLLEQFHKAYPGIRSTFYEGMMNEVALKGAIYSQAVHYSNNIATWEEDWKTQGAWTRVCFGDPRTHKPTKNSYIAHPPQSLNAQTLNHGFWDVFNAIAIHPDHANNFKLMSQIHDSIFFQYRIGHDYLCEMVVDKLEIPITIKGYDNKIRTFTVPASAKKGLNGEVARYWSETE